MTNQNLETCLWKMAGMSFCKTCDGELKECADYIPVSRNITRAVIILKTKAYQPRKFYVDREGVVEAGE